jgi:hypothetical protein
MKALLDERRPLICHVDFDPNDPDDDMHWVLITSYVGDTFQCNDPWSGKNVPVDVYGGSIERAVIEFRAYDPVVSESSVAPDQSLELDNCRLSRDSHWNDLNDIKTGLAITGEYAKDVVMRRIDMLIGLEHDAGKKEEKISELTMQIQVMEKKIIDQQNALTEAQTQLESTVAANLGMQKTVQTLTVNNTTLQKAVQDLKDSIKVPTFRGFKKTLYDWLIKG